MRQEALVYGEKALCLYRLAQTVEDALVEVAMLVVQPGHDRVCPVDQQKEKRNLTGRWVNWGLGSEIKKLTRGVHDAADDETRHGAASQVQRGALLHAEVADEPALGEEVGGELDGAPEAGADHGGADAAVEAADALGAVDLRGAVEGVAVAVLGADGQEGGVALEAGLDEEERAAGGGADDARRRAAEHVDGQVLLGAVLQQQRREPLAHRLVEPQPAPVQQDLVYVRAPQAPVDAPQPLVPYDDADAVERAPVVVWLVTFRLELALELHPIVSSTRH